MMQRSLHKWLLVIAVIFVLFAVYDFMRQTDPVSVQVHTVKKGLVKQTVANTRVGTVKACRRAYLAPGRGGEVVVLNNKEGDQVKQGQILLEVWNEGLKAELELTKAEIHSRRAAAEQQCKTAEGSARAAHRLLQLKKHKNIVSEEVVDLAETKAAAEQAACRAARQQIKVSQARLKVGRAALERTILRAPFAGTVAEVNAELGEYITPSPPGIPTLPAIDLIDNSCLYISAPIDEVDAPLIATGMSACVTLDAFKKPRCSGTVVRIAPYVLEKEKQARTLEVEIKLTQAEDLAGLLPGYSADIEVLVSEKTATLRIPTSVIMDGNKVLLRQEDGLLVERDIETGLQNWQFTEVLDGLDSGEQIVLSNSSDTVRAGVYSSIQP